MKEKIGDLWLEPADFRCIPTSGATDQNGCALFDSPWALEAARRYRDLDVDLGRLLAARGNHVHVLRPGLVSFPVKQFKWSGVSVPVVQRSARELCALVGDATTVLPRLVDKDDDATWELVLNTLSSLPDNILILKRA